MMDVLFAVLPFADYTAPAIGVSLLKAQLARHGFSSRVRYFSFDFAEAIGPQLYDVLASPGAHSGVATTIPTDSLLGEWFFARAAFGDQAPDDREYRATFVEADPWLRPKLPRILRARRTAEALLDAWTEEIAALSPRVVGFTTVFHQTCACLALARRLKQLPDPPVLVFGGANCAGPMGVQMLRSFPWIDYVCIGEGDEVFPEFLRRLLRDGDRRSIPGVVGQDDLATEERAPLVRDLDTLPVPDYAEFFQAHNASPRCRRTDARLLIETSRGCWWGEKHHCTFCGLNAETMAFRAKSPDRVMQELRELLGTYPAGRIDCVDNILYMQYLRTLFPRLAEEGLKLDLFYEVKANLRYDQLVTLRDAGIRRIQAGIESFSDEVLKLMRKGCTGLQNIQLLRWGAELGMDVIWNIIFGFPGESPAEYQRMARLVPLLVHLQRPSFFVQVRLDRFSPNFMEASQFGLARLRPAPAYPLIFPLPAEELQQLAYFFDFDYADGRDPKRYTRALAREVRRWEQAAALPPHRRPRLELFDAGNVALLEDTRAVAREPVQVLRGLARAVYLACDTPHSLSVLAKDLGAPEAAVRKELGRLIRARVLAEMGGKYLSLAVFRARGEPEDTVRADASSYAAEAITPRTAATSV